MLFNSFEYIAFLLAVFVLYWACVRYARVALGLLLVASLVFYASWSPWYLLLIVASTLVDYTCGRLLARTEALGRRRLWLWVSVIYNLGVLATFKYFNWFMEAIGDLVALVDARLAVPLLRPVLTGEAGYLADSRLDFLLPVGISFFTFQSMSYTIDIYRRRLDPVRDYPRYLLYVSFFPQLVAGPIVRARDLLPQLLARPPLTDGMGARGLFLIGLGLLKKVAIADPLAINIVDRVFETPAMYSSVELLMGVYGYAIQIYCDFSGYSDIAIGSALLLGFRFPDNFDAPYRARDLQDFWRRWHISLSSWLRDYLYISLGGNRGGAWFTYRNLMLTMILGGLWHGAGWNFLIWGALHGVALAVQRAWQRYREARGQGPLLAGAFGQALAVVATFHYVCFAWIFFRATTFEGAAAVLAGLAEGSLGTVNLTPLVLALIGAGFATHLCPRSLYERAIATFGRWPAIVQAGCLVAVGFVLRELAVFEVVPFLYFQF
ncbi:MAG: MBOAT family protein [bacterium]|nr:MBOAT family protein [Myxococcales bacterium]MCB9542015.1 MBOAT family protein [Myxococcales bacterium]MCB9552521.1 MBOAT family protein [Myxococcales bacterium]